MIIYYRLTQQLSTPSTQGDVKVNSKPVLLNDGTLPFNNSASEYHTGAVQPHGIIIA
jgi:hypothetical protein